MREFWITLSPAILLVTLTGCATGGGSPSTPVTAQSNYGYELQDIGALPPGDVGLSDADAHVYPWLAAASAPVSTSNPAYGWHDTTGLLVYPTVGGVYYPAARRPVSTTGSSRAPSASSGSTSRAPTTSSAPSRPRADPPTPRRSAPPTRQQPTRARR